MKYLKVVCSPNEPQLMLIDFEAICYPKRSLSPRHLW